MRIRSAWDATWRPSIAYATAPSGADRPGTASQDGGWVHLVSTDGTLNFGRGHLKMWMESAGSAHPSGRQAQLDSFTPSDLEPRQGDRVMIRPEIGAATHPVIIREYQKDEGRTAVVLDWVEDDLPTILVETGGNGSSAESMRAPA